MAKAKLKIDLTEVKVHWLLAAPQKLKKRLTTYEYTTTKNCIRLPGRKMSTPPYLPKDPVINSELCHPRPSHHQTNLTSGVKCPNLHHS
jgi:hypothetical protein